MFTEVFGGGKADLVLVDENDVLESGIDIVARPPGKQLPDHFPAVRRRANDDGRGFAVFDLRVKPSPFCVLDELDAPLDESNIDRFIRVLQRFLARSQFIIITHNKRTIGMADVLYGVTMEEHGVSKIVSVKFHKSDQARPTPGPRWKHPVSASPPDQQEDTLQKREETIESLAGKLGGWVSLSIYGAPSIAPQMPVYDSRGVMLRATAN